jgi:hypothetical protein
VTVLYGSNVLDSTLSTACVLATTSGGTEVSATTTIASTSNPYAEVLPRGGASTAVAALPSPTGKGWIYFPGIAGTYAAGNWSASITHSASSKGVNTVVRFYKYSSGAYTSIGTITATSTTAAKTTYSYTATAMSSVTLGATDGIYVDLWWFDNNSNAGGDNPVIYTSNSSTTGVVNDVQITTSTFTPSGTQTTKDISIRGRVVNTVNKDIALRGRIKATATKDLSIRGNVGSNYVIYGSNVANGTLATASTMSSTTGGVETSATTNATGTSVWVEVLSRSASIATVTTIGSPSGKGWVFYPGGPSGGTFTAGPWSAIFTLQASAPGTTDITVRFYKYNGTTYSSIGTINKTGVVGTKTTYTFTTTSFSSVTFGATDALYVDLWWHDTSGADDNPIVYESNSATNGVTNDAQVITPVFIPSSITTNKDITIRGRIQGLISKDLAFRGKLSTSISKDVTVRGNVGFSGQKDISLRGRIQQLIQKDIKLRGRVSQQTIKDIVLRAKPANTVTKDIAIRARISTSVTKDIAFRGRVKQLSNKDIALRGKLKQLVTKDIAIRGKIVGPPLTAGGFGLFANGTGIASYDHFRATQYPDPSLSLSTITTRLGQSIVSWNDTISANTTFGMDTSIDGVNWTDVTNTNGAQISGLYSQPDPTIIDFDGDGIGFTSTYITGGSVATWIEDDVNSDITAIGGVNAVLVYDSISQQDVSVFADIDISDAGGLVWRYIDPSNCYYLIAGDTKSTIGTANTITLYRIGYTPIISGDAPLAYYRLGENGGLSASDFTGNNYTGIYSATGVTYSQTGAVPNDTNTAVLLNGTAGKVTLPTSLNPTIGSFTFECWFKVSSFPVATKPIIANYNTVTGVSKGAGLQINSSGQVVWTIANNSGTFVSITSSVTTLNIFHHVVGTYDGISSKFYLDGTLVSSSTFSINPGTDQILIGSSPFNDFLACTIDEVAIYNRALSQAEVSEHYSNGSNPTPTQLVTATISYTTGPANDPYTVSFTRSTYHRILADMEENTISISVDGEELISFTDDGSLPAGKMGLFNNGGTALFHTLWMQPLGDYVTGTPPLDVVTGTFIYTRQRLSTTQPTETPNVQDITTAGFTPEIGAGTALPNAQYGSAYISQTIDDLATTSNYSWHIDNDKHVIFHGESIVASPWILQSTDQVIPVVDLEVDDTLELDVSNDLYRNRQTILGALDTLTATATFNGDGSSKTFTLGYPLASQPTILFNGVTQTVGLKGTFHSQWYYAAGDPVIEQDASGSALLDGDLLSIPDYQGYFVTSITIDDVIAQLNMAAIEGGTGIVENVEDHTNDVPPITVETATVLATQLLARYAISGRTLVFNTSRNGLELGQSITIYLPEHGIVDNQFLITQIEITLKKGVNDTQIWWYKVTASELPKQASWAKIIASGLTLKTNTA